MRDPLKIQSLSELRQFHQVVNSGSFSEAARVLNQTPAAVSAGVKRLENHLGVRLLERSTRKLSLTEEGQQFFEDCQHLLTNLDSATDRLRGAKSELAGHLTIGAPGDLARVRLMDWIQAFRIEYPDITFDVRVSDSLIDLQESAVNLAIRFGEPASSNLIARLIGETEEVACASPTYLKEQGEPMVPQDLMHHDCIRYRAKGLKKEEWTFFQHDKKVAVNVSGSLTTDDSSLARQWAINGWGIVYKSEVDVQADIDNGLLVPLLKAFRGSSAPLYVVYPSRKHLPERTRAFIDFLLKQKIKA